MTTTAAILAALLLASQTQVHDPLLAGYVEQGLRSNLALQQRRLSAASSLEALREARGMFLPSVALEARYTWVSGATLDLGELVNPVHQTLNQLLSRNAFPTDLELRLPQAQETKLRVVQPLFRAELWHNHELRESLAGAEQASLAAFARQLATDITTAYFNYAKAARVVELFAATTPLLEENLRVSEQLVESGKSTLESVHRARAELSALEQRHASAERSADAAAQYLNFLLNRPLGSRVEVSTSTRAAPPPEVTLKGALELALANREELQQLSHGSDAAEAAVSLAGAAFLPGLSAAADYGFQGQEYDFSLDRDYFAVTLLLDWNLFRGFQDDARREQAQLEASRVELQRAEVAAQIALQVRQTLEDTRVAWAAIESATDRLHSARETFALVAAKYEAGAAAQIDYLEARTRLTDAEINRVLTTYDYLIRRAELSRAVASDPITL